MRRRSLCIFFFFFSSRRRHTRCSRDWSSDVCSSDLFRTHGLGREAALVIGGLNSVAYSELHFAEDELGHALPTQRAVALMDVHVVAHPLSGPDVDRHVSAVWRDRVGTPLVEQFRVSGLGGNDEISFVTGPDAVDLSALVARSDDFIAVFDGGPGNDILMGTPGRDRLDGGRDDDVLFGFGGDDRLWGDSGTGDTTDHDVLFGGQGDDDLIGGMGTNQLFAWTQDPNPGFTQLGLPIGKTTADPVAGAPAAILGLRPLFRKGVLPNDVEFFVTIGAETPVRVVIPALETRTHRHPAGSGEPELELRNQSRDDLVDDINEALSTAGIGERVVASL